MNAAGPLASALSGAYRNFATSIAVEDAEGSWTYAELGGKVREFATDLRQVGLARGDRIVLLMAKSVRLLAWQLACIDVGLVGVPLAVDASEGYVEQVAAASGAAARVGDDGTVALLPSISPAAPAPFDAVSLLFTSGSTGRPKGVVVRGDSILNLARWGQAEFAVGPDDVLAVVAPLHFAASIFDVYTGLLAGARLRLVLERDILRPDRLLTLAIESGVTIWTSVASVVMLLTRAPDFAARMSSWDCLRLLVFSGERMPLAVLKAVRAATGARLVQFYGTTETNVCASYDVPAVLTESMAAIPVGKACAGHRIVLGEPSEDGQADIFVGGPGVMHGYWGAEPIAPHGLHLTGDRGSLDPHGNLVLRGRGDDIVKIRGRRVDLSAVESVAASLPGVLAAVALHRGEGIDGRLVLAVEVDDEVGQRDVMRQCAAALPSHLRPDTVLVGALPRTPRGKVDRQGLRLGSDARVRAAGE